MPFRAWPWSDSEPMGSLHQKKTRGCEEELLGGGQFEDDELFQWMDMHRICIRFLISFSSLDVIPPAAGCGSVPFLHLA